VRCHPVNGVASCQLHHAVTRHKHKQSTATLTNLYERPGCPLEITSFHEPVNNASPEQQESDYFAHTF